MKVGDYVRTKDYQNIRSRIGKIIKQDEKYYYLDIDEDTQMVWEKDTILNSSPNIIDLIEVGDYVNGFRVNDSSYGLVIIAPATDVWEMNSIKDEFKNNGLFVSKVYKLEDIKDEIKSIVTKEQFERMEYKVGE